MFGIVLNCSGAENHENLTVSAEYQNFDTVANGGDPPPAYASTSGGESSVIPSRYQRSSETDSSLAEDLQRTASGRRDRTRRKSIRRTANYRIDADSEEGSDSTVDEDYEVASILSSIPEGLT